MSAWSAPLKILGGLQGEPSATGAKTPSTWVEHRPIYFLKLYPQNRILVNKVFALFGSNFEERGEVLPLIQRASAEAFPASSLRSPKCPSPEGGEIRVLVSPETSSEDLNIGGTISWRCTAADNVNCCKVKAIIHCMSMRKVTADSPKIS